MPGSKGSLEQRLSNFLDEYESDREEAKQKLEHIESLARRAIDIAEHSRSAAEYAHQRLDRHTLRISHFERTDMLDTGQHSTVDVEKNLMKRELEKKEENERWWKRSTIQWFMGGVAWIVMTILASIAARYGFSRGK